MSSTRHDADKSAESRDFWALKEIAFNVEPGEVLGIIGKNGAGKSTLLKILSRVTSPTTGSVRMRRRVASLLEVGTGFHPELTGRENVFLNGALLGMSRSEVRHKFSGIAEFSGIETFLDTPVKRYSSGMYTRLAFAVAAHLEPEILVVDEVLAVGDAEFQKRCLTRMNEVAQSGRTVLLVSHNMNAIEELCSTVMHLADGRILNYGRDVRSIISNYLGLGSKVASCTTWTNREGQFANPYFQPVGFRLVDTGGEPLHSPVRNDQPIGVQIHGRVKRLSSDLTLGYCLLDAQGRTLYWSCITDEREESWPSITTGHCVLSSTIPPRFLNEGEYRLELCVKLPGREWCCQPAVNGPSITLEIRGGLSDSPRWKSKRPGPFAPVLPWTVHVDSPQDSIRV